MNYTLLERIAAHYAEKVGTEEKADQVIEEVGELEGEYTWEMFREDAAKDVAETQGQQRREKHWMEKIDAANELEDVEEVKVVAGLGHIIDASYDNLRAKLEQNGYNVETI